MRNILIIEQDKESLENFQRVLESNNFNTIATTDSLAGIRLARRKKPSLVLCSDQMPKLSGYEVLQELRRHEDMAMIPFVLMTQKAESVETADSSTLTVSSAGDRDLDVDGYLRKPCSKRELLQTVKLILEQHAKLAKRYQEQLEYIRTLKYRLEVAEEACGKNRKLLEDTLQHLRQPILNSHIALHLLKNTSSDSAKERYIRILEEEFAREVALVGQSTILTSVVNLSVHTLSA